MKPLEIGLSIITVHYRATELLITCLKSINKYLPKIPLEILVISNSQNSKLKRGLKSITIPIRFIQNKKNLGFAKAVNKGIRLSRGKLLLLLNPDTRFFNYSLTKLLDFQKKSNENTIIGGKIYKTDRKSIQYSITGFPNLGVGIFEFSNIKKIIPNNKFTKKFYFIGEKRNKIRQVVAVSGAFMLIERKIIEMIGYFDEKFFMYLEDIDYCIRANKAGYKVIYYPGAAIIHHGGKSSKSTYRINEPAWNASRKYFFKKHQGPFWGGILLNFLFTCDELIVAIKHKLLN